MRNNSENYGCIVVMLALLAIWILLGVGVLFGPNGPRPEDIFLGVIIFFTGGGIFSGIIFVVVETFEGKETE